MTSTGGRAVLRWAGATDIGKVRSINQDQYMLRPEAQLWVVADGMGGHRGGEVASHLACEEMAQSYRERTIDGLVQAVSAANRTVYEAGLADPELRGMGTTMVAMAVVAAEDATGEPGEMLAIANVGDSRAYRLALGELEQLTQDHSLVADMVREGSLSPDDAETHPQKNILTRVLGVNDDVPVDITTDVPRRGDRYLLCSDGLFNEVSEEDIEALLQSIGDPDEAAHELIRLALTGEARDNATVVIVDVLDDGRTPDTVQTAAVQPPPAHGTGEVPSTEPFGAPDGNGDLPDGALPSEMTATSFDETSEPEDSTRRRGRRARRRERRAGNDGAVKQRRFTWRVGLFVLLLLAVFGGAIATIQWYGEAAYFVGFDGDDVVIYRGRPGGVLWIDPELVERSSVDRGDLRRDQEMALETGREYASLDEAQDYVAQIEERAGEQSAGRADS